MSQSIVLAVDYHDQNCVIRQFHANSGEEQVMTVITDPSELRQVVKRAQSAVGRRARVVWIQESTTGWPRVQALLGDSVEFLLANVLQMPRPPKGRGRKTDKIDTARIQREYRNGSLPLAHQPPALWRQVRRLVSYRENLVARRTSLRNWINRYLAHETWHDRTGLWSVRGQKRLRSILAEQPPRDATVALAKLDELQQLRTRLSAAELELLAVYHECPAAQRLDAVRGIGFVSAVSIVARIGPVTRFRDAEHLIAYAGLAPGVQQSDQTRRDGRIGGGGTD